MDYKTYEINSVEAASYIDLYRELPSHKFAVIKIGGDSVKKLESVEVIAQHLAFLHSNEIYPIIIPGAGIFTDELCKELGIPIKKINGMRVTDEDTMWAVMESSKKTVKLLADAIENYGGRTERLDEKIIFTGEEMKNYECVARISGVNIDPILEVLKDCRIPILSYITYVTRNGFYVPQNANADMAAEAIVHVFNPRKYVIITNIGGVMREGRIVSRLSYNDLSDMLECDEARDGMRPKLESAKYLLERYSMVIQITSPHNLLTEILTERGNGTYIHR